MLTTIAEAKKRKHHRSSSEESLNSGKTKTKTKWSSSTNLSPQTKNSMVATEEHGYYVKRTFLPLNGENKNASSLRSPPFLAVPIAWFACKNEDCLKLNSLAINSNKNSLSEGFLCDDDCTGPYEPICGKTSSEVAVFYNKCKLNVAKCRSHGYWLDLSFAECQEMYPEEVQYAEMKFKANPFFRKADDTAAALMENQTEAAFKEETTTASAQLLIQELKDVKPVEKMEKSKDSYEEIKTTSGMVTEMKL